MVASMIDIHEHGCGITVSAELLTGMPVTINGDVGLAGQPTIRGTIAWCRPAGTRLYRAGIAFAEPLDLGAEQKKSAEKQRLQDIEDHYELLQLSPNADTETVQRVYRLMAQRYHPDNRENGDAAIFRRVLDAYKTLIDPEKRAAYDSTHHQVRRLRWRIFDQGSASQGVGGEKAKRDGILGLLYTRRRNNPESPGMSIMEIEDLLGIPREHLDFSLWYLREQSLIVRTDNGRFSITVQGVDQAEAVGAKWLKPDRLLPAASGV
jgi:hypothetical protein